MSPDQRLGTKTFIQDSNLVSCESSTHLRNSIVVSIPACHARDRGSIPRQGEIVRKNLKQKTVFVILYRITTPTPSKCRVLFE